MCGISLDDLTQSLKAKKVPGVDKATENIQHLIKWIMDCYGDACKLILCCEDDAEILESVKDRCKVIKVDAPVTHEVSFRLIMDSNSPVTVIKYNHNSTF